MAGLDAALNDRAVLDLLLRIPHDLDPRDIWDLGCGAGEQAALLAARHPTARVRGLDRDPERLAIARARPGRADWVEGDIETFAPEAPPDLIVSNDALQGAGDHASLLPRLVAMLAPGGVLACQMTPAAPAEDYHAWLSPLCAELDIWTTRYLHGPPVAVSRLFIVARR